MPSGHLYLVGQMMNSLAKVTNSFPGQRADYYIGCFCAFVILLHVVCDDMFVIPGAQKMYSSSRSKHTDADEKIKTNLSGHRLTG